MKSHISLWHTLKTGEKPVTFTKQNDKLSQAKIIKHECNLNLGGKNHCDP